MAEKLRVAHVLPVYSDSGINLLGGGERYALNLARNLTPECDVTLFTFGPRHSEQELLGMRHIVLRSAGGAVDNPVPRTPFMWTRRFDVVHAHQLRTAVTSALALACRVTGTPLIATDLGGGGRSLMFRLQLHRLIPRFVMISDFSKSLLPASAQGRAAVVHGGVDLDVYRLSDSPRARRAVLIGRILPHKGINYLIEAAGSDIPVVIAGRIADARYFEELKRSMAGTQVTFAIDPSDDAVRALYETSAVTVSASVYRDQHGGMWPMSELLGLTLLESMAVGTPVVCTNVGGMPEYVVDGTTGYVVAPNDSAALRTAIAKLLDDTELARRVGRAGHDHVQQYSWPSVAAEVLSEYRMLVGSKAS